MATAVIKDVNDYRIGFIKSDNYFNSKLYESKNRATIASVLPFRVKFVNIGINAYGPNNPAPIGIAIIGYSNYVL